jgi:hypothetical protein
MKALMLGFHAGSLIRLIAGLEVWLQIDDNTNKEPEN